MRHAGLSTLIAVQKRLEQGEPPGQELLDGALKLLAGALFLVPGFMTDLIALLLLLPLSRILLRQAVMATLSRKAVQYSSTTAYSDIIEGECRQESGEPHVDRVVESQNHLENHIQ